MINFRDYFQWLFLFYSLTFFLCFNSAAPGLFGVGWSDRLADFPVRTFSDSVLPNSWVPLRVGHCNGGNDLLSLDKEHSIRETPH
jgi:hypothetical protein